MKLLRVRLRSRSLTLHIKPETLGGEIKDWGVQDAWNKKIEYWGQ